VSSAGLYPTETFPGVVGMEVAGTVVALPTDAAALAHPEFQKRNLKVGSKVATVGPSSILQAFSHAAVHSGRRARTPST
jgi:NADPH:quinone reductase-like Zn-dependent oxidoreductase